MLLSCIHMLTLALLGFYSDTPNTHGFEAVRSTMWLHFMVIPRSSGYPALCSVMHPRPPPANALWASSSESGSLPSGLSALIKPSSLFPSSLFSHIQVLVQSQIACKRQSWGLDQIYPYPTIPVVLLGILQGGFYSCIYRSNRGKPTICSGAKYHPTHNTSHTHASFDVSHQTRRTHLSSWTPRFLE